MDNCPMAIQSNSLNIKNHKKAIAENGLGPADPRKANTAFWTAKGKLWKVTEGDARGRLCSNCEHYLETSAIQQCIDEGPAKKFKTSMVDPALADIESKPVAYCMLLHITCSPTRTCNEQELGGPIDDVKYEAIKMAKKLNDSNFDFQEFDDPFKSSVD